MEYEPLGTPLSIPQNLAGSHQSTAFTQTQNRLRWRIPNNLRHLSGMNVHIVVNVLRVPVLVVAAWGFSHCALLSEMPAIQACGTAKESITTRDPVKFAAALEAFRKGDVLVFADHQGHMLLAVDSFPLPGNQGPCLERNLFFGNGTDFYQLALRDTIRSEEINTLEVTVHGQEQELDLSTSGFLDGTVQRASLLVRAVKPIPHGLFSPTVLEVQCDAKSLRFTELPAAEEQAVVARAVFHPLPAVPEPVVLMESTSQPGTYVYLEKDTLTPAAWEGRMSVGSAGHWHTEVARGTDFRPSNRPLAVTSASGDTFVTGFLHPEQGVFTPKGKAPVAYKNVPITKALLTKLQLPVAKPPLLVTPCHPVFAQ